MPIGTLVTLYSAMPSYHPKYRLQLHMPKPAVLALTPSLHADAKNLKQKLFLPYRTTPSQNAKPVRKGTRPILFRNPSLLSPATLIVSDCEQGLEHCLTMDSSSTISAKTPYVRLARGAKDGPGVVPDLTDSASNIASAPCCCIALSTRVAPLRGIRTPFLAVSYRNNYSKMRRADPISNDPRCCISVACRRVA